MNAQDATKALEGTSKTQDGNNTGSYNCLRFNGGHLRFCKVMTSISVSHQQLG